ncbi:unknown [Prevotella sp. CAG:755]|nr:unknown [Prevotella sp. CAG:755]
MPVEHAARVKQDFVGNARHVVGALRIVVAVGNDELLAFFEVGEGAAQCFERGGISGDGSSLYVYAINLVVRGSHFDGCEQVFESGRLYLAA